MRVRDKVESDHHPVKIKIKKKKKRIYQKNKTKFGEACGTKTIV